MVVNNIRGRTALAMVGATAGLASVLSPLPAHAVTDSDPDPVRSRSEAAKAAPGAAAPSAVALPTCRSWSDFASPGGIGVAHIPTVGRGDFQWRCALSNGNAEQSVYKLQDALNRCYDQTLNKDGIFGDRTEASLRIAQQKEGIDVDGEYGEQSSVFMQWPVYVGNTYIGCRRI